MDLSANQPAEIANDFEEFVTDLERFTRSTLAGLFALPSFGLFRAFLGLLDTVILRIAQDG